MIGTFAAVIIIAYAIPGLLAGYGLLKFAPWARILTIVLALFELLRFPFGTCLGVYSLWVMLSADGAALFRAASSASRLLTGGRRAPTTRWLLAAENSSKQLDPVDVARTRSREIGVGVDGNDSRAGDRRKLAGQSFRLGESEAARRDDHDLGVPFVNVVPRDPHGIFAGASESIDAAGDVDHLRNPVSGAEEWIRPLEEAHARTTNDSPTRPRGDDATRVAIPVDEGARFVAPPDRFTDREDVVVDLGQRARREIHHIRPRRHRRERARQLVAGRGAHLTEILREHDVGREVVEQSLIDDIQALAAPHPRRDGVVDLGLRQPVERSSAGRLTIGRRRDVGRIVALVRPSDEIGCRRRGRGRSLWRREEMRRCA